MAFSNFCKNFLAPLFLLFFLVRPSLAFINCEDLSNDQCTLAVSSTSNRCVLESYRRGGTPTEYICRTSTVTVARISNHIESDECVGACGVDRSSVGISSDALLEDDFKDKLCSPGCFRNCPNVIDLYYNLAAAEGAFLPDLCRAHRMDPRRANVALMSSGEALGPSPNILNVPSPTTTYSLLEGSVPDSNVASPRVRKSPSQAPSRKLLQ